jgi:hypothetical protein
MPTTSNFGWTTPADTDLVKDGAAAIRTLGNGIDTSLVDLKGGTTGQVLSKASNTDLDYSWVTTDDANAIQNAIVDAKGDLIAASAADTPARLAVGNNGETLVADSAATTGLRWQGNYAAGKNKIINGDFNIWQRGTTFTNLATNACTSDRWAVTSVNSTVDVAQSSFTAGAAPVAGYESQFFASVTADATDSDCRLQQRIENVRTFAGQTITVSFYAKSSITTDALRFVRVQQNFGATGSPSAVVNNDSSAVTLSSAWTRYSFTFNVASISGKTITNGDFLGIIFGLKASTAQTLDLWGVQVEAGSVATAFQTATGTLQGELAACQRYFQKSYLQSTAPGTATTDGVIWNWVGTAGTGTLGTSVKLPVTMRIAPTLTIYDGSGNSAKCFRGAANKSVGTQTGSDGTITVFTTDATSSLEWYFHFVASAEL